ncbi:hypothetical protein BJAS_P3276 [Bathymodiolus japonicus methanotrophic gill symbiont]|uniref:hypothetical protein n=1 Tax=Bathymodiolus japonicus methanotrophic gill symbiont TaxID=113269 RepID=UPI001B723646|nr:hypothetical protein [Bathymodiolus japonicus methanotrophic gill symbiont]GFO72781.1 hypothetical protein BJAS_P3276 [Bathymodiolus japonicus methanotrophic gill symbiont]
MAFYFVSTFANAQTPTKQRPYGYRGLKIITSLRLRFPDFQRWQKTSSGQRSTAKPTVIDFNANSITYSYTSAYRSSEVSHRDVKDLFEYKIEKLEISLDNSTKNVTTQRNLNS